MIDIEVVRGRKLGGCLEGVFIADGSFWEELVVWSLYAML